MDKNTIVPVTMGIKGFGRFVLRDLMGRIVQDTGWIPNVITNSGMAFIRDSTAYKAYCGLGTSNTTPAITDTDLTTPLPTRVSNASLLADAWSGTSYRYERKSWRFGSGVNTGAIREAAVFPGPTGDCFSHFLAVDGSLTPITITKGVDNILDVYYEVRNYPPTGDATGAIDITGVSYDYTLRACQVGNGTDWKGVDSREILSGTIGTMVVYDGNIGATTGSPSGTSDQLSLGEGSASSVIGSGDYYNDVQLQIGLDNGNFGGGLRSVKLVTGNCRWQCQYDATSGGAAINKDLEKRLRLNFRLAWARL